MLSGANSLNHVPKGQTGERIEAVIDYLSGGLRCVNYVWDTDTLDWVAAAASGGATTVSVFPLQRAIENGTVITVEQFIVLTVAPLAEEIGSVTWVFTNEAFKQKLNAAIENVFKYQLDDAISRVVTDIKKETAKVI